MRCSLCGAANGTALYGIHGLHAVLVCTIRGDVLGSEDQKLYSGRAGIGHGLLLLWGPNSLLAPSLPVEHGSRHALGSVHPPEVTVRLPVAHQGPTSSTQSAVRP